MAMASTGVVPGEDVQAAARLVFARDAAERASNTFYMNAAIIR